MTIIQSIILGFVQGLTEFLPISSSGHLVIVPFWFGWNFSQQEAFIFDVLIQDATLLAVIVFFWRDLLDIVKAFISGIWNRHPFSSAEARLGWYLILATIPAGLVGISIKNYIEELFSSPLPVCIFLLLTALLLLIGDIYDKQKRDQNVFNWVDALWMGLFQALAILPGVSRSGSTITGGLTRGLDRTTSARFSFLMSIPIMLAAGLLAGIDLVQIPDLSSKIMVYIPGFIVAAITGYISIRWLLSYISKHRFWVFSLYCLLISIITFLIFIVR